MADQNILDKSMRSVFVGNIPYEATEEKLKDIFNEVGPVISFKLVYDRETGKPKGYGFCEYKDQETALSAMRNLNGYEISGRTLRVDNACTEKSRLEMQSLMMGMPSSETHYGDAVNAEKAPEIINNIVSSLPPEQMYDLMKQMKECIQNNPVEARNMLLQNPQLGYALLQAQVIMKIVDPEVAKTMMHAQHRVPGAIPSPTVSTTKTMPLPLPVSVPVPVPVPVPAPAPAPAPAPVPVPVHQQRPNDHWRTFDPMVAHPPHQPDNMNWPTNTNNRGRGLVPNLSQLPPSNHMPFFRPPPFHMHSELARSFMPRDYPMMPENRPFGNAPYRDLNFMNLPPMSVPPPGIMNEPLRAIQPQFPKPSAAQSIVSQPSVSQPSTSPSSTIQSNNAVVSDTEKASLIMQVLQLTDAQIAMLPPDQRQSILDLKEKIAVSQRKL